MSHGLPKWRVIAGEKYVLRLLQVATNKGDMTPDVVKILTDEESVGIKGGERFITAYIHEGALAPESEK